MVIIIIKINDITTFRDQRSLHTCTQIHCFNKYFQILDWPVALDSPPPTLPKQNLWKGMLKMPIQENVAQ